MTVAPMHSSGVANGTRNTGNAEANARVRQSRVNARAIDQPDADSLLWVGGKNDVVRLELAAERHDVSHTIHFCVLRSMRPQVGVVLITDLMVQIIIALMLQLVVATSGHT